MLFNSTIYLLVFLPLVFVGWRIIPPQHSKLWLLSASIVFYGYWNIFYVPLLAGSMVMNFLISRNVYKQKSMLILGIILNLIPLGFYKYTNFVLGTMGFDVFTHLMLPLGISFYTFQQMAYLVDAYRGQAQESDFISYALFVSFFPQLIAGPIVHHREMMPQMLKARGAIDYDMLARGLLLLSFGLFKKVIIADSLSPFVQAAFDGGHSLSFFEAWIAAISFTLQLYFDFSGYTDMALGAGMLFGIKLPQNFNSPYKALNIQDFWRRWHMTLSRWLRDYVYIPLGGKNQAPRNIFITFTIGGLWHGAGWTFVLWGMAHACALIIFIGWARLKKPLPNLMSWAITFLFITLSWVLFRAADLESALRVYKALADTQDIVSIFMGMDYSALKDLLGVDLLGRSSLKLHLFVLFSAGIIALFCKNSDEFVRSTDLNSYSLRLGLACLFLGLIQLNTVSEFLYFNF